MNNTISRRDFLRGSAANAFGLALTGTFGAGFSVNATLTALADEADSVTIRFAVNGTEAEREAYWSALIEKFESQQDRIKVELEMSDDFNTKLTTEFAAGDAPDVMYDFLKSQGIRIPLGQYASLDDYVNERDAWDDFLSNAAELGSYNGIQYGIPIYADPRVFVINRDLFEAAGLDPDSPPTNWDELLEYSELLTIKDESGEVIQTGFSVPSTGSQLVNLYSGFLEELGVKNVLDDETDEVFIDTEEGVEALEFLVELRNLGYITWDSADATLDPFLSGKSGMTITTTSAYRNAVESGLNVSLASPLTNKQQATFCGMHFLYASSTSEHLDEVWEFIEFAEQADNMWDRYEQLNFVPLRDSVREQYIEAEGAAGEVLYESISVGTGSPRSSYEYQSYINEAIEKVFLGQAEPAEALSDAAEQIRLEISYQ